MLVCANLISIDATYAHGHAPHTPLSTASRNAYTSPTGDTPIVVTPYAPGKHTWDAGHRGVDLAAENGTPVFSAGTGTVIYAGILVDRPVISIEHANGVRTTYEPVEPLVSVGDAITAGTQIGTVAPGHKCGKIPSCFHWGAKRSNDIYMNPMWLLTPPHVRLLE